MYKEHTRPILGIKPKCIHDQERLEEILKAIDRYREAELKIPDEWIIECQELNPERNNDRFDKEKNKRIKKIIIDHFNDLNYMESCEILEGLVLVFKKLRETQFMDFPTFEVDFAIRLVEQGKEKKADLSS